MDGMEKFKEEDGMLCSNYHVYMIVDNAKVISKGPKEIRTKLGLSTGDRVTLVCDGDQVIMTNAAICAMKMLQKGLESQADAVGLDTEKSNRCFSCRGERSLDFTKEGVKIDS
jgi:bifunctional DNA-binding transcriptional regulator/antitoxin component of YhaV-PrlF toxin-antitoxin module